MRVLVLVLTFLLMSVPDGETKDRFYVHGRGNNSCGKWTAQQAHRPKDGEYTTANVEGLLQLEWVVGFISAFNKYQSATGDVTRNVDTDGITAWIDNYCAAHPLDAIVTAAMALISELSARGSQ